MTVSELAVLVGGQLASGTDGSAAITNVASLAEAGSGDVTFLAHPRYRPLLTTCAATAALVPADFTLEVPPARIFCENPGRAFAKVLEAFAPPPLVLAVGIHPTAAIGKDVTLGEGVSVHAYAVIEDRAVIGARTVIGAHCYIGQDARIGTDGILNPRVTVMHRCIVGDRTLIHSGAVIGADGFGFEFKDGRHVKVPQTGIVEIQNDVEIGANTCIDRARFGRTVIGEGTKLDNLVQVGHNVQIGKHCLLCGQVGIAGSVRIGNYVTLAGQSGTTGHITIGDQVTVGGGSGVTKSLKPKEIVIGFPAVPASEWKEQTVHLRQIGAIKKRVSALEKILLDENKIPLPPI
jgi:UDP-3-O-[3-hydroxymyristoyl] glucosamine N-acyltransferase